MEAKAKAEEEAAGMASSFGVEGSGRYNGVLSDDIPRALAKKLASAEELIQAIRRLHWRKSYELMVPVLWLGPGKSFGELAVQKDASAKLNARAKVRQATVLCRTDCKFAVMSKADYQSVLDNIDRRRVEALKDFFK